MFLISEGAEIVLNNADKSPLDFSGNELKNDIKGTIVYIICYLNF